jgi:hypothetical protein
VRTKKWIVGAAIAAFALAVGAYAVAADGKP